MRLLLPLTAVLGLAQAPAAVAAEADGVGLVRFELARTTDAAHDAVTGWSDRTRAWVLYSLMIDMGLVIGWAAVLRRLVASAARRALETGRSGAADVGGAVSAAVAFAAALDLVQNAALSGVVAGHAAQPLTSIAFGTAIIVISTLLVALGYVALFLRPLRVTGGRLS